MNGYGDFKYRIVFGVGCFLGSDRSTAAVIEAWDNSMKAFLLCTKYMTDKYEYGPELKLVKYKVIVFCFEFITCIIHKSIIIDIR